jgi:hypothetical protein
MLEKGQSCGDLMTREMLRSSAKIKSLQRLIELHRSLLITLKRKYPGTEFFIVYVPIQQFQGQLQTQYNVDTGNYIKDKPDVKIAAT